MTKSTHRGVLLLTFAMSLSPAMEGPPIRADPAAIRRPQARTPRAHRDGYLALDRFNRPPPHWLTISGTG